MGVLGWGVNQLRTFVVPAIFVETLEPFGRNNLGVQARAKGLVSHVAQTHSTEFVFLAPNRLARCQRLMTVILPILLPTLSITGPIMFRHSGALLPTSEAFPPTDQWGHFTQI